MLRIIWMLLANIWRLPGYLINIFRMGTHPERYPLEERYAFLHGIAEKGIKSGRIDVVISGLENLPQQDGYILYPNHQGMFDIMMLVYLHQRPLIPVLKKELENIPVLKQLIVCMDGLVMDRDDVRQSLKVINKVAEEVKKGKNYLIFAEGTREKEGNKLQDFKGGSFKSATKSHCPIVPVALIDCYKPFDINSLARVTVQAHVLKPILYEEYKNMRTMEIAAVVSTRINEKMQEVCEKK